MKKLWLLLLVLLPVVGMGQVITTVAGGGTSGLGDGGPATAASLGNPHAVTFDKFGNLYISDFTGCRIRKVDTFGVITTVVGPGTFGVVADGGPATAAFVKFPEGVVCDTNGNLYIADHQNFTIRKVDVSTGIISKFAGTTGVATFTGTGDGGPATAATFWTPGDILFDKKGNLYVSDNSAHTIRKINTTGIITAFAGIGNTPGFSGDGGPATAAQLRNPAFMTLDDAGSIYVADQLNKRVRKIDTSGIITTVAGTGIALYSGDGGPATASNVGPLAVTFFGGNLYITDSSNRVRIVDNLGIMHTVTGIGIPGFSGDGSPATGAVINNPGGITTDSCGNVYFSDVLNVRIRKVTFTTTCAPTLQTEQIKPPSQISIYPNPATTELTISAPGKIKEVGVYDLLGRIVGTYPGLSKGEEVLRIPVGSFSPGIYFVRIVDEDGGVVVRRVVKE